jgi:hypothetical protein
MMMKTDQKKKPPMAKAIREFVTGMHFPPAGNSDANYKSAALIVVALQHSTGITEGATTVTCTPSYAQLADILHCTVKTIQRQMDRLIRLGFVTSKRRGYVSNEFTIYQTPQVQPGQQVSSHKTGQQVSSLNRTPRPSRQDNKPVQPGHLDVQPGQQVSYSGVEPQGLSQEKPLSGVREPRPDDGFVFSGKEPAQLPDLKSDQSSEPSPKNPAAPLGAVAEIWDDGILTGWQLKDGSEVTI